MTRDRFSASTRASRKYQNHGIPFGPRIVDNQRQTRTFTARSRGIARQDTGPQCPNSNQPFKHTKKLCSSNSLRKSRSCGNPASRLSKSYPICGNPASRLSLDKSGNFYSSHLASILHPPTNNPLANSTAHHQASYTREKPGRSDEASHELHG